MRPIALLALIFGFMGLPLLDGQVFTHSIVGIICSLIAVGCGLLSARRDPPYRREGRVLAALGALLITVSSINLPSKFVFQQKFNRRSEQYRAARAQQLALKAARAASTNLSACDVVYLHSPWEDEAGVRAHMDFYKHIFAITVDENYAEDHGLNVPGILHFKGTVVTSYKGDWKVSEKISFIHNVDYRPSMVVSNGAVGARLLIFTSEHTNTDIALGTGDFVYEKNNAQLEQVLRCFFQTNSSNLP